MAQDVPNQTASIVVVGAGQAGFAVVNKLRDLGHAGPLTLIGREPQAPYQRPPLSKAYLFGEMTRERMQFRSDDYYHQHGIDLRLELSATRISCGGREVELSDGSRLPYDRLVLTTGASPRQLPATIGGDLEGVFTVRTLADADAMIAVFRPGRRLLVVGGGYVGLEAAASAVKLGLQVILIEASPRILQRVAAAETADHLRSLHQSRGVDLREATGLTRLIGESGRVVAAELSDGTRLDVDLVVVGIGVIPDVDLAQSAGLDIDNGIRVDEFGQTSAPQIFAAGDCASFPYRGGRIRLESVGNAIDQGEVVAMNLMGQACSYEARPWFWSDQYDAKLQIAGLSAGYDQVLVRRGSGVSFWYFAKGQLIAVDAVNEPKIYMIAKRLLDRGAQITPEQALLPEAELRARMQATSR